MAEIFKYMLTLLYVLLTYGLAYMGMRKARSLAGFSIGNRDMGAGLIGLTMAASIASAATFIINPGFVYVHGLSAYLHYGVAGFLGISVALVTLCKGFRRLGDQRQQAVLTIPHWMYLRYNSRGLAYFFAGINLLSITFVVLILVGCAILCASLFGISQKLALVIILAFVFSYVLLGGAYAHAYTNAFQGLMMVGIALFIFATGWKYMGGGFFEALNGVSAAYAAPFNPESSLYYDAFSVLISSFLITFALMMQPHILTKTFYLKNEAAVNRFLVTALIAGFIFTLMLFIGFFARFKGLDVEQQDQVVAAYIAVEFGNTVMGQMVLALISVALLAAGMSTLDGILVALSAMVVNDIVVPLSGAADEQGHRGLVLSRYVLVVMALLAFALAWNPPALVGLFAQKGVYGIAAASFVPICFGVWYRGAIPAWLMGVAAFVGLGGHLLLNLGFGFHNPSVSASWAMIASASITALLWFTIPSMTQHSPPEA